MIEDSTRLNGKDCIRFVPQTIESNFLIKFYFYFALILFCFKYMKETYISIFSDSGCYSYVGKQIGDGPQMLSLEIPGSLIIFCWLI